jgi:hypothetical protein
MKYIFFMALLAIVGLSAASIEVQITNPEDGARIELGKTVIAEIILEVAGEENISARLLVDGTPTGSLTWRPTTEGEYVLTVQAANNPEFVGAVLDFVVVTVYDDTPRHDSSRLMAVEPTTPRAGKKAPPGIPKDSRDPATYDPVGSAPP